MEILGGTTQNNCVERVEKNSKTDNTSFVGGCLNISTNDKQKCIFLPSHSYCKQSHDWKWSFLDFFSHWVLFLFNVC